MKTCSMCKNTKPADQFRKVARLSYGLDCYCIDCRTAYQRNWSSKHRDKELERYKKYREKNKEKIREKSRIRMRAKRLQDIEAANKYTREYRKRNPEKANLWDLKKVAKRKWSAVTEVITEADWIEIKQRYKNCCVYCLKPSKRLQKDHVIPLSRGGSHTKDNIVPACASCNASKNANDALEWVAKKHGRLI